MTKQLSKKKGIFASIIVMLFQGWEGIILTTFALVAAFAGILASPAFASASLFAKEIFTFIISAVILGNKKIIQIFKKGFTRTGAIYAVAFIIGSSIGSLLYIISVMMAGPGYAGILTATYPVFITILLRIFQKEKSSKIIIFGIVLTITGGVLFLLLPSIATNDGIKTEKIIGMSLSLFTALCWSIEGVIINFANKRKIKFSDRDLSVWKSFVSLVFISIVIMPISMMWGNSYIIFKNIFTSWKGILIILALAINLIVMRVAYTYSIRNAGVKITSIIDTNNFLVGPIIASILSVFAITYINDPNRYLFNPIIWWSWFLLIPIISGAFIVIYFSGTKKVLDHEK